MRTGINDSIKALLAVLLFAGERGVAQEWVTLKQFDVIIQAGQEPMAGALWPNKEIPLLPILAAIRSFEELGVPAEAASDLRGVVREFRQAARDAVPDFATYSNQFAMQQKSEELAVRVGVLSRRAEELLTPPAIEKLSGLRQYLLSQQGGLFEFAAYDDWRVLFDRTSDFWETIEAPSRQARRTAVEALLECLDASQNAALHRLVDESVLYATETRNDVLYCQLASPCPLERPTLAGPFIEILASGWFVLRPNGSTIFRTSEGKNREGPGPMHCLTVLQYPSMVQRLNLVDEQVEQLRGIQAELRDIDMRISLEAIERGDIEHQLNNPELKAGEESARRAIEQVLLPHQTDALELEIAVSMVAQLGLFWTLESGPLGKQLKISADQKIRLEQVARKAAEDLRQRSVQIHGDLLGLLEGHLPPKQLEALKKWQPGEEQCPAPEAVIPVEMYRRCRGRPNSPWGLRSALKVASKSPVPDPEFKVYALRNR